MATTTITIEGHKQLSPRVVNLFQENNRVDTIIFTLSPYIQGDVDLSTFNCYVVTYGIGGIDQQKLPFTTSGTIMTITWLIDNYTLSIGQTLSYQVVFKANDSSAAVWHSYKGILFCNSSIAADESIASNYPTILRQFELRIEEIAEQILFAYCWMPIGTWTPVSSRIKRRFYLNKQTNYDNSCLIEDDSGNVISPLAKSIVYEPGNYSISENLQNVIDYIIRQLRWCTKFCVNDGNVTNGTQDLMNISSGTLGFKIGDSYPSLTATQANGECFSLSSAQSIDCSALPDDNYNIFLDKYGSGRAIKSTIYRQRYEPSQPANNDIWYKAATNCAKIYNTSGYSVTQISCPANECIVGACSSNDTTIAISYTSIFRSTNGGASWTSTTKADGLICCDFLNSKFLIGTANGKIISSSNSGVTWTEFTVNSENKICGICFDGTYYYAATNIGTIYKSSTLENWALYGNIADMSLNSICYHGGKFIACGNNGNVAYSENASSWTSVQSGISDSLKGIRWLYSNTFAICCPFSQVGKILVTTNGGITWNTYFSFGTSTLDIAYINGSYVVATSDAVLHGTSLNGLDVIPGVNRRNNVILGNKLFSSTGNVYQISSTNSWYDFHSVPVGKITVLNGEITSFETFPYNQNCFDVNAETVATTAVFGALRTASATDEQTNTCVDAAITPSNIFRLMGYRIKSTTYSLDSVVGCPYHASLALKCTTAGTTSNSILDLSIPLSLGGTITDGTVVWTVVPSDGEVSTITTAGDIIIGGSNGKESRLGIGTTGQVLMVGDSGLPIWHDETNPITSEGDMIVGDSDGEQARLSIGSPGQVLKVNNNGVPAWDNESIQVSATLRYWS